MRQAALIYSYIIQHFCHLCKVFCKKIDKKYRMGSEAVG